MYPSCAVHPIHAMADVRGLRIREGEHREVDEQAYRDGGI
jgi:hypothetical protein